MTAQSPGREGSLKISVIVPVRNGRLHLAQCLDALVRSEYPTFEVIVVDDCSTDADITPQIAERYGTRYLQTSRTMGPGGARNLGSQHARGDILAFIDSDVVVPPGALSLLAEDFLRDLGVSAVFGSYDDKPAWPTFIAQYKNLMHHYVHQISSESPVTFWAGCGAIRKSVFDEIGGFDGTQYTLPSIEDIALGLKLVQGGRRIFLDKRIQAKHLKRWTFRSVLRADILNRAVPWSQLILKTRQLPRDLNLTYSSRVSSLAVCLLSMGCIILLLAVGGLLRIPLLPIFAAMASLVILLVVLNLDTYRFFLQKRGWWFTARAVVFHWLYYLYSGATFFLCALVYFAGLPFASAHNANKPASGNSFRKRE
jgi:glycosyltransferase involved in cell wall biosynthesis